MSSDETENPKAEQDIAGAANDDAPESTAVPPEAEAGADPAEALAAENADLKDRLLRTVAEMENLRKRTEREIGDTRSYAIANFARDMLVVTDNLSRALTAVPEEQRESADETLKSLIEGIEMTEREMYRSMQKHGVKLIEAEGQKFDPHRHQAVFEIPNTEVPEGTVLQVMQAGFAIGERVLRPAMVGVSKGGPKSPAAKSADAPGADNAAAGAEGGHVDKEA